MALQEFSANPTQTSRFNGDVISLTFDGWYFGEAKPDFEFARILFDREKGIVKFEPIATKEHNGIGVLKTYVRRGKASHRIKSIAFAKSGIAPLGKYRKVEGEENTFKFFMPSSRSVVKENTTYARKKFSK